MQLTDSITKRVLRSSYTLACGALVLGNSFLPRRNHPAVYYGGARAGDVGGPLVKVQRLNAFFPEVRLGFNLAYLLSNTPYLPDFVLQSLKKQGVPIVYNQNGVFYKSWYKGDWEEKNRRMASAYHAADWVFYQSEFCRRAADRFLGTRLGSGEVLYNAVDTRFYVPSITKWDGKRECVFLVTGKIGNHLAYRLESTIAGLHKARKEGLNSRLIIAGWVEDGAGRKAVALTEKLGISDKVTFTGPYTQDQSPSIYKNAHAYITTKYNDPCPNTVLEALASGLPILYSGSGGVPELVGDEAGVAIKCLENWEYLYIPTAEEISEGMIRIMANHHSFSETARRIAVERFDITLWIKRHSEIFEKLLTARQ